LDKNTQVDKTTTLKRANEINKNTLMETLGIVFTDFGDDFVEATMPVNPRVHQPAGLLHGGATAALAESLGSLGSFIMVGDEAAGVVGIEINANHIRSIREGLVTARGTLLHKGRKTHVWDIKVTDEEGRLISVCRLTNMILPK
jgi:uncharacterized protein (TIGR00369 family)